MKNILILALVFFALHNVQAQTDVVKSVPIEYDNVELQPQFPGGYKEFIKFLGKNYKAPEVEGLSGVVKMSFVIETDGSIGEIKIVKDIGDGAGDEAKRVLKLCPKWTPGEQEGNKVRVLFQLPITIKN